MVTGSNSAMGEATAKMFANEGLEVIIHGRNPERSIRVVEAIVKQEE